MSRVVVVAPFKAGAREEARRLIESGPPFEPEATALLHHHVYLTDREVVFVFEGPEARATLERLIGDPGVWHAAAGWRACLDGRPRLAQEAFSWDKPSS